MALFKEQQEDASISTKCALQDVTGTFVEGSVSSSNAVNHDEIM